ncbi:MAG: DMT family transporter [Pseudomonadota bacterium]
MHLFTFSAASGALLGALTVLSWASFNVAAKAGIDAGMSPAALSFLRYTTPALLALPMWYWLYRRAAAGQIALRKLAVLSVLGGPIFGLIAVAGYQYAPLSHGLLFAPVAVFVTGILWAAFLLKEKIALPRILGALVMFAGLALLVGVSTGQMVAGWPLGIALFVIAGVLWGSYTALLRYWQIPTLEGTAAVASFGAIIAAALMGPIAWDSLRYTPLSMLMTQILMQGVVGGVISVVALFAGMQRLSTQTAAMLPTFTPAMALLIAWATVGSRPEAAELLGAGIIFAGFVLANQRQLKGHRPMNRRLV